MELGDIVKAIRRYWRSALACLLATMLATAWFVLSTSSEYTATASLFVAARTGDSPEAQVKASADAANLARSLVQLGTTQSVLEPVRAAIEPGATISEFSDQVKVTSPTGSTVVQVAGVGRTPEQAALVANQVAEALVKLGTGLAEPSQGSLTLVDVRVVSDALAPVVPNSKNSVMKLMIGLLLGLFLGFGQAVLRAWFDPRVVDRSDLAKISSHPVIGEIPLIVPSPESLTASEMGGAEAFRWLAASVSSATMEPGSRSILVTSTSNGDGKTTVAAGLAESLVERGESVLLIDTNLRTGGTRHGLSPNHGSGLMDVVAERVQLDQAITSAHVGGPDVLTVGTVDGGFKKASIRPTAVADVLNQAAARYKWVILDSGSAISVSAPATLASLVGVVLVVVDCERTRRREAAAALELIERSSAEAIGVVLNRARTIFASGRGSEPDAATFGSTQAPAS